MSAALIYPALKGVRLLIKKTVNITGVNKFLLPNCSQPAPGTASDAGEVRRFRNMACALVGMEDLGT